MLLHHQAIEGLRRALHSRSASSRHRRYPSCLTIQAHLSGITFEELSHCLNPQQDTGLSNHPTVPLLQRDTSCLVYQDPSHIHDCYQNHIADSFNVYLRLSAHLLLALSCVVPCTACSRGNLYQRHLVRFSGLYRIDYMCFLLISPCDFFIGRQIYLVDRHQFGTCQSFLTHVQGLITAWMFASIAQSGLEVQLYPDACFCLTEHQQTRSHCSLSVLINI